MKIALFYYDGFSEFEVVLIALFFRQHDLITVALEKREYRSEENQRFLVDQVLPDVDVDSIDLLVIPGGDPTPLIENRELKSLIGALISRNKKVAGICGGTCLLAGMGFLIGKRCTGLSSGVTPASSYYPYFAESTISDEHVVVDGNIITAQGQAYVEFAVELARQMNLCSNEEDYEQAVKWFKNIR